MFKFFKQSNVIVHFFFLKRSSEQATTFGFDVKPNLLVGNNKFCETLFMKFTIYNDKTSRRISHSRENKVLFSNLNKMMLFLNKIHNVIHKHFKAENYFLKYILT